MRKRRWTIGDPILRTDSCPRCGKRLTKDRSVPLFCSGRCRDRFYGSLTHAEFVAWEGVRRRMIEERDAKEVSKG